MEYKQKTLSNGIRVVLAPLPQSQSVTVLVLVKAGSRYEDGTVAGISHFIEHMVFKGTKKRPTTLDLSRELDSVGADFNAYTGKDHTGYYIRCASSKLNMALDVISDMLINSKFDPEEIKREKEVIVEEIKMYEDNPLMHIEDLFEQTIFKGSSLGRSIAGTKEIVRSIGRQDMMQYIKQRYLGSNMVIAVAGNTDDTVFDKLEKHFALIPNEFGGVSKHPEDFEFEKFRIKQKNIQSNFLVKKTEQVQMKFGFPSYSMLDERIPALNVLSIILGGNMSSRLFIKVRERLGLCYFIRASVDNYQDVGSFNIHVGLDSSMVNKALQAISWEIKDIKENGVTEEELVRTKDFIAGKLALRMENTANLATFYADQALLEQRIKSRKEKLAEIDAVSLQDIQKIAQDLFMVDKANISLIGDNLEIDNILKEIKL